MLMREQKEYLIESIDLKLARIEEELNPQEIKRRVRDDVEIILREIAFKESLKTKIMEFLWIFGKKKPKENKKDLIWLRSRMDKIGGVNHLMLLRRKTLSQAKKELSEIRESLSLSLKFFEQ